MSLRVAIEPLIASGSCLSCCTFCRIDIEVGRTLYCMVKEVGGFEEGK